jgi:hypothetical protein
VSHSREVLKKLIDKTAEFVADEGWEFDTWLAVCEMRVEISQLVLVS